MADIRFTQDGDYDPDNFYQVPSPAGGVTVIAPDSDGKFVIRDNAGVRFLSVQEGDATVSDGLFLDFRGDDVRLNATGGARGDVFIGSEFGGVMNGEGGDDQLYAGGGNDLVLGGAGADILSGGQGNDTLFGGAGADILDGGQGIDLLVGGAGADTFNGDAGIDTVSYSDADTAVIVLLQANAGYGGDAEGDSYVSVENVIGSAFDDFLEGGTSSHVLDGGEGNDVLTARGAYDILIGGAGGDRLIAEGGGRSSFTTASYTTATTGVSASLLDASSNTGDAAGDSYANIDNLTGSAFDDSLTGDAGDNVLTGGAGADRLDGGDGIDTVSYAGSAGVNVDLGLGRGQGGDAKRDTYVSIENVTGTDFRDVLTGTQGANILIGGAGADKIVGGGGDDRIYAGAGRDVVTLGGFSYLGLLSANGGEDVDALVIADGSYIFSSFGAMTGFESVTVGVGSYLLLGEISENLGTIRINGVAGSAELVKGTQTDDRIIGGAGDDQIGGGLGADMVAGGAGADRFFFESLNEISDGDRINDFSHADGDKIVLRDVLAHPLDQPQRPSLTYIGTDAFSGEGNELRIRQLRDGGSIVQLDTDADGKVDHSFFVRSDVALTADDFVLAQNLGEMPQSSDAAVAWNDFTM